MPLHELIPILQVAIGPVIMISGVGILMLSMTNRLARIIDRSRQLLSPARTDPELVVKELGILERRARFVRLAITLASLSLLFVAVMVIAIFVAALFQWASGVPVAILFILCMACLIASLLAFLADINLSLAALKLEIAARKP